MTFVEDENRIPEAIDVVERGASDALDEAGREMVDRIEQSFDRGRDALGRPWTPLSPETIRRKGNDTILVDSGDLRDSFEYAVDDDALRLSVGTNVEYAVYHEFGVPSRGLPARPILLPALRWAEQNRLDDAFESVYDRGFVRVTF